MGNNQELNWQWSFGQWSENEVDLVVDPVNNAVYGTSDKLRMDVRSDVTDDWYMTPVFLGRKEAYEIGAALMHYALQGGQLPDEKVDVIALGLAEYKTCPQCKGEGIYPGLDSTCCVCQGERRIVVMKVEKGEKHEQVSD